MFRNSTLSEFLKILLIKMMILITLLFVNSLKMVTRLVGFIK